jgi:hypothetical protein
LHRNLDRIAGAVRKLASDFRQIRWRFPKKMRGRQSPTAIQKPAK